MDRVPQESRPVTVGGDTHGDVHVVAVVDGVGRILGTTEVTADVAGYRSLIRFAEGYGPVQRIGVEGTGAYGAGLIHPTYLPNIGVFLSMLTSNPLIVTLVALGFIVGGFAIANVVFVNSARVMMAMGLDGSLPRFFSDVSDKRHTPVKAATLWAACALGVCAIFSYIPSWFTIVLTVLAVRRKSPSSLRPSISMAML